LFDLYLERHAKVHKKTWAKDVAQFRLYFARWASRRLASITRADVESIHTQIAERHGRYAANRALEVLRVMFNRAGDWGWSGHNPATGVRRFREQARERFLTAEELPRFFEAVEAEPNPAIRDCFLILLLTGARRGNVQSMRWEDVDLDRAAWTIPETKSGRPVTVPLSSHAVAILRLRRREIIGPYVFPGRGKSRHLVELYPAWKRLLSRAKLHDVRIHDLRRTLGSWQAATGASLPIIGKSLGHSTPSTTQVYARLDLDPVRKYVNRATRAMLAAKAATQAS
jgi:integrase